MHVVLRGCPRPGPAKHTQAMSRARKRPIPRRTSRPPSRPPTRSTHTCTRALSTPPLRASPHCQPGSGYYLTWDGAPSTSPTPGPRLGTHCACAVGGGGRRTAWVGACRRLLAAHSRLHRYARALCQPATPWRHERALPGLTAHARAGAHVRVLVCIPVELGRRVAWTPSALMHVCL